MSRLTGCQFKHEFVCILALLTFPLVLGWKEKVKTKELVSFLYIYIIYNPGRIINQETRITYHISEIYRAFSSEKSS